MKQQQVIWITGASSGIGAALARHYAALGWRVAATARRAEILAGLAAEVPNITPFPADVTDAEAMRTTVQAITHHYGKIDIAVLNAGTNLPNDADQLNPTAIKALMEINLMGVINSLSAVWPLFKTAQHGHVAVVSSIAGVRGLPTAAAYCASKAAVIALTESLKFEADALGLDVSLILPGFVTTPLTDKNTFPMPCKISAEEAAKHIERGLTAKKFLIHFPKRFTTVLQTLRLLPYCLYFPIVRRATRLDKRLKEA